MRSNGKLPSDETEAQEARPPLPPPNSPPDTCELDIAIKQALESLCTKIRHRNIARNVACNQVDYSIFFY